MEDAIATGGKLSVGVKPAAGAPRRGVPAGACSWAALHPACASCRQSRVRGHQRAAPETGRRRRQAQTGAVAPEPTRSSSSIMFPVGRERKFRLLHRSVGLWILIGHACPEPKVINVRPSLWLFERVERWKTTRRPAVHSVGQPAKFKRILFEFEHRQLPDEKRRLVFNQ